MGNTKIVNSIQRATRILELVSLGNERLEDIHPKVGLSRSTTHRLLKSLVAAGLAAQNPVDRRYHIGPKFLQITSSPLASHRMLSICAYEELTRLRDISGESTLIIVPSGIHRLVVKMIPSLETILFSWPDGNTVPIYVGSAGKVLLAQMDGGERDLLLRAINMVPRTPNTIVDQDALKRELETIRNQGFATSFGESFSGGAGISVPVKNYVCPVALCISGPEFRFNPTDCIEEMKTSAERISHTLASYHEHP
jgi:IclR family acetate operon transcriptional repressor